MKKSALIQQPFDRQRLGALVRKETLQILHDPSVFMIAVLLPVLLLLLFADAVSLDIRHLPMGVVLQSDSPAAHSLAAALSATPYLQVHPWRYRRQADDALLASRVRGYVVLPEDFDRRLVTYPMHPIVEIVSDGSQPNTANFTASYASQIVTSWWLMNSAAQQGLSWQPRFWFNEEVESRRFLLPGALAIVMTIIGTLLSALLVAREWERGTMEALMATPVSVFEILLGKLLPYFVLAMLAMLIGVGLTVFVFNVPLRGSLLALLLLTAVFLLPALGQGLLISVVSKNQFVAAQMALLSGYLPAFMLSGFLFEIDSMPWPIRMLTHIVAARYFVDALQTLFLTGDVWPLLRPDMLAMLVLGLFFFLMARRKLHKTLE